jgi:hypothetical protein
VKSNFYKDLATPIFNSPFCGFVRVQRILIFVAGISIQHGKGAAATFRLDGSAVISTAKKIRG